MIGSATVTFQRHTRRSSSVYRTKRLFLLFDYCSALVSSRDKSLLSSFELPLFHHLTFDPRAGHFLYLQAKCYNLSKLHSLKE